MKKQKLVRIATIPGSLKKLLEGQLHFMNQYYEVIAVSSDEETLQEMAQKDGLRHFSLPLTRKITFIKDIKAVYKLYRYFRTERPFIVHTHTPKAGIVGMLAARLANVPHRLHTVAGLPLLEASGIKRKILNFVESLTYRCATRVYPNSKGLKQIILDENFTQPKKLNVLGNGSSNGISTTYFDPSAYAQEESNALRASYGIPQNDIVLIFIGRLVGDKGINELVKAFTEIQKKHTQISLVLVGRKEPELDPLHLDTLKIMDEHPKIFCTGFQPDVRPYFACSDILVFPSYREGFPNVVMQANAMNLPAIVTDINGCNEIITDGYNGIIIPPKDITALSEAINALLVDPDKRKRMAEVVRNHIKVNYQRETVWDAILKEYKSLEQL